MLVFLVFVLTNTNPLQGYLEDFSRFYFHRGLVYSHIGDAGRAVKDFKKSLLKHPRDPDIYLALGDVSAKMGDSVRAEISYRNAMKFGGGNNALMLKVGVACAEQGKIEEAKTIFKAMVSASPDKYPGAHINLGNCYKQEGYFSEAEEEYKKALQLKPASIRAHYLLAMLYKETGRAEAQDAWNRYEALLGKSRQRKR